MAQLPCLEACSFDQCRRVSKGLSTDLRRFATRTLVELSDSSPLDCPVILRVVTAGVVLRRMVPHNRLQLEEECRLQVPPPHGQDSPG